MRAVTDMGHALGMTVTVEGVETAAQLAAARQAGCAEVQGYHFARPMPASAIDGFIALGVPADKRGDRSC